MTDKEKKIYSSGYKQGRFDAIMDTLTNFKAAVKDLERKVFGASKRRKVNP